MKYETKAILTVPAWADAMHEGGGSQRDEIKDTAMAYAYVPLIFRATRLICNSLVAVPVHFFKGETEVDWPFPDVSLRSLLWRSQAAMCLTGANFIEKMPRKMSRKTGGLMWVNPTTMNTPKLIRADDGSINYEFSQKKNPNQKWDLATMIYMREFSLSDDIGPGNSSAGVALQNARLLHYMSRFAARFFETGAMPITVLEIEGMVDRDEAERIEGFFKKAATRLKNAWNVLALSRQIEPKVISQPLKDLVMPDLADEARRAVADAYDMHPSLLEEAPNRATATEHRLSLYQDSVEPRALLLAEEYNRQLLKPLGVEMVFAFDEMDIYQEDEASRGEALNKVVTALTLDPAAASWAMSVLGYDLTDEQQGELDKMIAQKEKEKEDARRQAEAAAQAQAQAQAQPSPTAQPAGGSTAPRSQPGKAAWADDLTRWQRKALRVLKETGSAVCTFESELIPADVREHIETGLTECETDDNVKAIFTNVSMTETPAPAYDTGELKSLADAINRLAQSAPAQAQPNVNVTLPHIAITNQMPEQKETSVTFSPVVQPSEVTVTVTPPVNEITVQPAPVQNVNEITVTPAPVQNVNEITVQPADVNIPKVKRETQQVIRDRDRLIKSTSTDFEYEE